MAGHQSKRAPQGWLGAVVTLLTLGTLVLFACSDGGSSSSNTSSTDPTSSPASLETPTISMALPGDTFNVIAWEPVTGAETYTVVYTEDGSVPTRENGTMITNATSPFVHGTWFDPEAETLAILPDGGLDGGPYCYAVIACCSTSESDLSDYVELTLVSGSPGEPGEEGFGNNLATPLLFAEGIGLSGQPTAETTGLREHPDGLDDNLKLLASDVIRVDGVDYYLQGHESFWRADWDNGVDDDLAVPEVATLVKWGDSLLSHQWDTGMKYLRVETALYQDESLLTVDDLTGSFDMTSLFGAMFSEYYGTTGAYAAGSYRHVFTPNARLRIDKATFDLEPPPTEPPLYDDLYEVTPVFDQALFPEVAGGSGDGPGNFYAEVTGSGNTTYGLVWPTETVFADHGAGWYRLTFSLEPTAYGFTESPPEAPALLAEEPTEELYPLEVPVNTRIVPPLPVVEEATQEEGSLFTPELVWDEENYPGDEEMLKSILFIYIAPQ